MLLQRDVPERAAEGGEEGEGRHVIGFLEGPVVRREGPRQRHLAQRDDEVGEPEEHEDVEELEDDEVLVVRRLAPVEREEALGVGAQLGDVGRVEGLERRADVHALRRLKMRRKADRQRRSLNPKQSRLPEDIIPLNFSPGSACSDRKVSFAHAIA